MAQVRRCIGPLGSLQPYPSAAPLRRARRRSAAPHLPSRPPRPALAFTARGNLHCAAPSYWEFTVPFPSLSLVSTLLVFLVPFLLATTGGASALFGLRRALCRRAAPTRRRPSLLRNGAPETLILPLNPPISFLMYYSYSAINWLVHTQVSIIIAWTNLLVAIILP